MAECAGLASDASLCGKDKRYGGQSGVVIEEVCN